MYCIIAKLLLIGTKQAYEQSLTYCNSYRYPHGKMLPTRIHSCCRAIHVVALVAEILVTEQFQIHPHATVITIVATATATAGTAGTVGTASTDTAAGTAGLCVHWPLFVEEHRSQVDTVYDPVCWERHVGEREYSRVYVHRGCDRLAHRSGSDTTARYLIPIRRSARREDSK